MIIDFRAIDHLLANCAYFSTYKEYHYEFQTCFGEIFTSHRYGDVVLRLAYPNGPEVIQTIKKVSWAPSLEHNLLKTTLFARKGVEVFL